MKVQRERRSAKAVIEAQVGKLLARSACPEVEHKLNLIEEIAYCMGWENLYARLKGRKTTRPWWVDS